MRDGVNWVQTPEPVRDGGPAALCRDVAQPGRALAWGARGRQFKSARPDHASSPQLSSKARRKPAHEAPQPCGAAQRARTKRDCEGARRSRAIRQFTGSPATSLRRWGRNLPVPTMHCMQQPRPSAAIPSLCRPTKQSELRAATRYTRADLGERGLSAGGRR